MATVFDNRVFALMADITECLCSKIAENGLPSLCFCGMIAGDQPYDATGIGGDCYDEDGDPLDQPNGCGQAWVRLVNAYPSVSVGVADLTPGNCGKALGFDIEVGILRCIRIEEKGGILPADEMLEAAQLQIADMITMQQALLCCTGIDDGDIVMGQYSPLGPEGGLVGGTWLLSVAGI